MNIGEKLFTYIDQAEQLTQEMVDQYKSSLIFLGDEQQIFQPLTGTYVGIGKSQFDAAVARLSDNTELMTYFDSHIHENVVNSIWVAGSKEHFDAIFYNSNIPHKVIAGQDAGQGGLGAGLSHYLMTNQDLVIRGLYDTNGTSARSTDEFGYGYDDQFDESTGTYTYNHTLWGHINRNKASNSNYKGSSGIQVNIHHTGGYKEGTDAHGFAFAYWEGHDYLTIDDSLTWAYITSQSSYIMEYSNRVAIAQANRVYHDILGGNEPVYIEKSFNEAFKFNDDGELVPIVTNVNGQDTLEDVYIHLNDGTYEKVAIYNDLNTDYYYIYAQFLDSSSNPIYYIVNTNNPSPSTLSGVDDGNGGTITINYINNDGLMNLLHPDDGYDKNPDSSFKEVTWYHIDAEATAQGQINLADGIQTFKEVTYILDQITNGSDPDISLTYNIAQNAIDINELKNWKNTIGERVVTDFYATSANKFTYVNAYSINKWNAGDNPATGETRLNIDLLLAQTYILDGTTYAAYLTSQANQMVPVWRYMGDETNTNYYYDLSTISSEDRTKLQNNLAEVYGASALLDNNAIDIYVKLADDDYRRSGDKTSINGISSLSSGYILFNYEKSEYPVIADRQIIDGLTTVNWVTSYVAWGLKNAMSTIVNYSDNTKDEILTYIHENMTYTDADYNGQYVSKVDQVDGKIVVTHKVLPLDTILASQEVFGNDFFIEITPNEALELSGNGIDFSNIYVQSGNDYINANSISDGTKYYLIATTNRFTKVNISSITDQNDAAELTGFTYALIQNAGDLTYFRKVGTGNVNSDPIMRYIPIDINELLTTGNLTYLGYSTLNELYYYSGSPKSSKYIDVSFRKNTEDGSTETHITSYVTYLGAATPTNTGLADAYDVRRTIENMFTWVNLKTNQFLN